MVNVFCYKGIVGIQANPESPALIAKPEGGSFGCVCDASQVNFSQEAIDALKTIKNGHDDLGDVDVFKAGDDKVIFGWMGGYMRVVKPEDSEGSRDCDFGLLKASENVEIPQSFIDFVDANF